MRRPIGAALFVLAGMVGAACEQPTAPSVTRPLFAAATTTPVSASGTLTITDPGKQWVSDDGIGHIRDQVQTGPVSGDLSGSIMVTGRSDLTVATQTGTGSGMFTITATGGTWEGSFEGTFDGGVFSGKLVAHGTGDFAGSLLRGTISQTEPNRSYTLTGTILNPGG